MSWYGRDECQLPMSKTSRTFRYLSHLARLAGGTRWLGVRSGMVLVYRLNFGFGLSRFRGCRNSARFAAVG